MTLLRGLCAVGMRFHPALRACDRTDLAMVSETGTVGTFCQEFRHIVEIPVLCLGSGPERWP